jgi:hypothetical protein
LEVTYDERGHQYKVPLYCISNPIELVNLNNSLNLPLANTATPVFEAKLNKQRSSKTCISIVEAIPIQVKIRINPGFIFNIIFL